MLYVRWLLAFAALFAGAATLGLLDAMEEWPRLLAWALTVPFVVGAYALIHPEIVRHRRPR